MKHWILLICLLLIGSTSSAIAQTIESEEEQSNYGLSIGLTGGISIDHYTGNDEFTGLNPDPDRGLGDTLETTPGYSLRIAGGYMFNPRLGVRLYLSFSSHQAHRWHHLPNAKVLLPNADDSSSPTLIDQTVRMNADWTYTLLHIRLLGTATLLPVHSGGLGLAFGLDLGQQARLETELSQELITPRTARFTNPEGYPTRDSGRVLIYYNDDHPQTASSRLSLHGGLFYDLVYSGLHITPGIYTDYALTTLTEGSDWTMHSLLFNLDLMIEM